MDVVSVMKSSVISGICIGIAGIGFLATRDIVGSVLFAFALLTVVAYKLKLIPVRPDSLRKASCRF